MSRNSKNAQNHARAREQNRVKGFVLNKNAGGNA